MSVTYRLIGGDIDVFLDTDASRTAKEFFITDIRGKDSVDVINGFNIGIQQYNEGQLAQFAMTNSIELYSFDAQRQERCVVRQLSGNPAGEFNGQTSRLTFSPGFNLASSGVVSYPIIIDVIIRLSEMQIRTLYETGDDYTIVSSDTTDDDNFSLLLQGSDVNELTFCAEWVVDGGDESLAPVLVVPNAGDRCLNFRWTLEDIGGITQSNLIVNDLTIGDQIPGVQTVNQDQFDFVFGAFFDDGSYSDYFTGIMRNIVVSAGGTEIINVINPSDGTNSVGDDGVVTDITEVTTITS